MNYHRCTGLFFLRQCASCNSYYFFTSNWGRVKVEEFNKLSYTPWEGMCHLDSNMRPPINKYSYYKAINRFAKYSLFNTNRLWEYILVLMIR